MRKKREVHATVSDKKKLYTRTRKSIDKNRIKRKNGENRVIATEQQSKSR